MLNEGQVKLALDALIKYLNECTSKKKPDLLGDDPFVYLTGEYKSVRPFSPLPKRIALPHNLFEPGQIQVCLFTKDNKPEVKQLLEEKGVKLMIKIISLKKLASHYRTFERRKQLSGMYDLYLADNRIYGILFKKLGKAFLHKRGPPFPVNLSKSHLKEELYSAIASTHYKSTKTTALSLRIGRLSMPSEHLMENTIAVAKFIKKHVPRGWSEVKVLYIKTTNSVALPIYNTLEIQAPAKLGTIKLPQDDMVSNDDDD